MWHNGVWEERSTSVASSSQSKALIPEEAGRMTIERTLKRAELFLGLDDNDLRQIAELPSCQ
jgi:hypothetical protein